MSRVTQKFFGGVFEFWCSRDLLSSSQCFLTEKKNWTYLTSNKLMINLLKIMIHFSMPVSTLCSWITSLVYEKTFSWVLPLPPRLPKFTSVNTILKIFAILPTCLSFENFKSQKIYFLIFLTYKTRYEKISHVMNYSELNYLQIYFTIFFSIIYRQLGKWLRRWFIQ